MSVRPEELLAAYADDGLEPEERAAVERFIEEDPDSARELGELQAVVGRLREHAQAERAGASPAWDAMEADIRQACDRAAAARARRWPFRLRTGLRRLLTPRPALAFGAAVMAAAALLLVLRLWNTGGNAGGDVSRTDPGGQEQLARSSAAQTGMSVDESVAEPAVARQAPADRPPVDKPVLMDEPMLDLFPDDLKAALDQVEGEIADGELLENAEWLADDMALLTGLELDALAEPMYEDLLEDTSDETLDELLAQAG